MTLPLALGVTDSMLLGLLMIVGSPALLAPLVCFLFRAIQWRRQQYTQRRGKYLALYYGVALVLLILGLGGFDLPSAVSSADLLGYLLWLGVGIATAIFFLIPPPQRPLPGLCRVCGYDLRAHAPGQKCPECGTPVPLEGKG